MCNSSEALARLTLPGGDSRTHRPGASQRILDIADRGSCRDLRIGEKLVVLKAFRNTVIVSPEREQPGSGSNVLVAPLIDFDIVPPTPAEGTAPIRPDQAGENAAAAGTIRDPIMDVPIGMRRADFIQTHGSGKCVDSTDGGEECYYSGTNKADCPAELSCYATIYEFLRGRLVAFHTQLTSESDWVQLYRLSLSTFGPPAATTEPWGVSTMFDTDTGVLDFARKSGPPISWHITLSYRPSTDLGLR